jgi:glucokinase
LGATVTKLGLLDKDFRIIKRRKFSTNLFKDRRALIKKLTEEIKSIYKLEKIDKNDILGIGVGLPGPIDFEKGLVHYFPNIKGFKDTPLRKIIQRNTGIKTYIDNDTNLMALAESKFGSGRGFENSIYLTLGTGVGGAIFVDGKLYRGKNFTAGEIGHIPIGIKGAKCNCGGEACLERYVGNRYILKKAKKIFKKSNLTLEDLSQMAKRKNKRAIFIWREVAKYLGVVLAGLINFFNPECIVIGGGISKAGRILFMQIRKTVRMRAMKPSLKGLKILRARLGDDAGIIGAALLVQSEEEG